jgi:beta-phosphoglucomutase
MKLVIFDMDGVLVDSETIYHQFHPYYFSTKLGIDLSQEEVDALTGVASREIYRHYKALYPEKLPLEAEVYVEQEYDLLMVKFATLNPFPVIDGIPELLEILQQQGYRIALSSSNQRRMVDLCLRRSGLSTYFENVLSGEDVAKAKPDPEIFVRQAEYFGVPVEECLVIEDSTNGCRAAKAAGMPCFGFINPHSGAQDLSLADWKTDRWDQESISTLLQVLAGEQVISSITL